MAKGPQTRDRILDTAFRLAARDGLEGLTLSTLAEQIGLSKSGLFAHFTSKEELQLEMLRVASERFVEEVMTPAFKQPRGLPRLRAFFEAWRRWATNPSLPGGCIFVAAAAELDDRDGPVRIEANRPGRPAGPRRGCATAGAADRRHRHRCGYRRRHRDR